MKNVLIHLHPDKKFDHERDVLAKIQIDNNYDLGWSKEDILLFTNFNYEYNGIKATVIDDSNYCYMMPRSTNTVTIPYLFDHGFIENNELYWVHDFDAYQLNKMEVSLARDVGLTNYGWSPKWNLGSFFFRAGSRDFFQTIKARVYGYKTEDERALAGLTHINWKNINDRYELLDISYNFGMRHIAYNYDRADKPLKVLHFHPWYKEKGGLNTFEIFIEGKNELGFPLVDERLRRIFKDHGI